MDEIRKKVIIQEIRYWKDYKLLPEQYCNYLLALYTEGEESVSEEKTASSNSVYLNGAVIIVSIIALFLNYFTQLEVILQMSLSYLAFIFLFVCSLLLIMKKENFQISLICSAFILVLATVQTADYMIPGHQGLLYILLLVNCIIWLIVGKKLSLLYLKIAGILGAIIICWFLIKLYLNF